MPRYKLSIEYDGAPFTGWQSQAGGTSVQDVNRLLKQFQDMQRMMKGMKGGRLKRMLGNLKGARPPGFL